MIIMGYFFLFLHKNRGYSLAPRRGASNEYLHHICFYGELENIIPKFSIAQNSS